MTSSCRMCKMEFNEVDLVTLLPCGCSLCMRCLLALQASNNGESLVHCDQAVVQHKVRVPKRGRDEFSEETVEYPEKKKSKPPPPSETKSFIGRFMQQDTATRAEKIGKDGILLTEQTLLTLNKDNKSPLLSKVAFSAVPANGKGLTEEEADAFVKHFRFFHRVLLPSSFTNKADLMGPKELLKHYMAKDGRILLLAMLAVATGYTSMTEFREARVNDGKGDTVPSAVMSIGMVTDLLCRAVNPNEVGPAVKCMSNLFRHASESVVQEALSQCKVVTTAAAGGMADAKEFIRACLEPEVNYESGDSVVAIADNVNWKILRGLLSGTVESWTLVAHRMPKPGELDVHYGDDALPRTPEKDWENDRLNDDNGVEDTIREVLLAGQEDYDNLNELLLVWVNAVMETYKTVSDMDFQERDKNKEYNLEKGIPKLERIFDLADVEEFKRAVGGTRETGSLRGGGDDDDETCTSETLFSKNNVKPSIPVDLNFAERQTIIELFEYLIRVADEQVDQHEASGKSGSPISKDFLFFCADGDPIKTGLNIKADDDEGKYSRIVLLIGIFHAFMEVFKKLNHRELDLVSFLVAPLYAKKEDSEATTKNISYFVSFNDPTQPEHEVGSILVALILLALLEMKAARRIDTTPAQVLSFMRQRAEHSPEDMRLFLLIKYFATLLLFRKAERCNKIELYFSCMRLSLPLLAVENAHNYVQIFTETLRYWDECSEAEKHLIKLYGFTMETPNGIHVGMDYGQEKYVRLVRQATGKIKSSGSQARIEHASLCRMSQDETEGIRSHKLSQGRDLRLFDGRVFIKTMCTLQSIGAWSEKPENKPREQDTNAVYSMYKADERLPRELLHTDSLGTDLVTQFARKFTCSTVPKKKSDKTGLVKRDYSAEGMEKECKRKVALATSIVKKALNTRDMTIVDLKEELKVLQDEAPDAFPDDFPDLKRLTVKNDVVDALVKVRTKAFSSNANLKGQSKARAMDEAYGGKSTIENRRVELQRPFCSTTLDGKPELSDANRLEL